MSLTRTAPNCPRPFASLRATCVGRDAGCAAELTPCACGAIRSNNCGKLDNEAALSFGRAATPHPAQRRRGQKGEAGEQPRANSQQPTANSQQPTANSRRHRSARLQTGAERSEGPHHLPYVSACGVVVAGLQSCRRTGLLRDLTRCGCLSGARSAKRVPQRTPQPPRRRLPRSEAQGSRAFGRVSLPTFLSRDKKVGRPPGRNPASKNNHPAGTKTAINGSSFEDRSRPMTVASKTCPTPHNAQKNTPPPPANQATTPPPAIEPSVPHPRCAFSPQAPTLRACPNPWLACIHLN